MQGNRERRKAKGTVEGIHKGKKGGMLEELLLRRSEWQKQGGSMVFLWTPSHKGV